MRLGAAVFVEIAVDPVTEWDDPEELAGLGGFLWVERFDGSAKLGQVGADPGVLVDRLDRAVEEAVRRSRRLGDFLAAHRRQLIDFLAEFGAVGIETRQLVDELRDLLVELACLFRLQRHQAGRFRRRDRVQRLGRIELQLGRGFRLSRGFGGHLQILSSPRDGAAVRR